jgi:hypothetical protein
MTAPAYACQYCGAPADYSGFTCAECHDATVRSLLASPGWCANAATRTGDHPGETMLDTMRREVNR